MTELKYLEDTYLFSHSGNVVELWSNEFGDYIILESTIFYPQWGGQPSDIWTISHWENIFKVQKCILDENWVVYHYGNTISWIFKIWDTVQLNVDKEKRMLNAKNHSAGHLLDVAMIDLWYNTALSPSKGYHFSEGPYVEYIWDFNEDIEEFITKLDSKMYDLIMRDIPIFVKYKWLWNLEAPNWKTPRYVYFDWYNGVWCWGTHIKSSWEIGWVSLRKVKYKKWVLRISYQTFIQ